MIQDGGKGAFSHNLAAPNSRARAKIHNPVGRTHGVFIVLDNNDCVSEIS
jgi:hypothetical protein